MQPVPEVLASAGWRRPLASLMRSGLSLDVVAADRQQATLVVANFRQVTGGRPVKVAPLVMRLIDPAVAARLRGTAAEGQARQEAAEAAAFPEPQGRA